MSSVYPYEDPNQQVDPTQVDQTQAPVATAPDTNPIDFNSVPLSGDSYAPPTTGGATGMPYLPPAQTNGGNGTPVGPNGLPDIAAIMAAQRAAQGSVPSSQGPKIGQNFKDWVVQDVSSKMPKAMSQVQVGNPPPPTTYGNDFAGSILSAEAQLPGGTNTQALVHGAQSQLGPLATAIAFGEGGALLGSAVMPGVGTAIGGLIGGLAGYWVGSQIQNEAGKDIVPTATMQALNTQWAYESQNAPVPLALGSLIPQFLAFKPNPAAIADTFSLIGKATVASSIAERVALVRNASPDVQNQLFMMAYGTGQTAVQAKQSMDQGNFNPTVTAIDLLGGTLLSNPRRWMQAISPAYRAQIGQARADILEKFSDGAVSKFNNETGIAPENLDLFREGKAVVLEGNRLLQANKFPEAIKAYTRAQEISQEVSDRQAGRPGPAPEQGVLPLDQATEAPAEPQVTPETQPGAVEPVLPGFDRPRTSVEEHTGRVAADIRAGNKEFPPEPTKETTPGGVATHIQAAVENHPAANAAFQALSPYGDVHVVGGAIRNMIAGKPVKDLDMTFSGSEQELQAALDKVGDATYQKTGDRFPVYRLQVGGSEVEIALHRTENPENQNAFATGKNIPIADDLGRRDFTANSMAVNVRTSNFVDPFSGLKHTQSKNLALVNPKSFAGDPVRMLRALRFIGDGYHANKKLLESMKENAALLQDIPPERIQTELDRIFSSEKPGKALEAMRESGVLDHIFPEHLKTVGYNQRSTHHNQLLWDHIVGVVNKVSELNPDPDVRMAAFLHDISKPDTQVMLPNGKASYHGHEDAGAQVTRQILTNLKYPNDRIARIEFLVKNHMVPQGHVLAHPGAFINEMSQGLGGRPDAEKNLMVEQRIQDWMDIRQADQANHPVDKADIPKMKAALESVGIKAIPRAASNIDGNDLKDMGLTPGPIFSKIFNTLNHEVTEQGLANEHNTLLNRARELAGLPEPHQFRRDVPHDVNPWPAVRRAVLEHGGIGPSKDWDRADIPGDLYRASGKPPDIVAQEATIGRADIPPWGEDKSDSEMMSYLKSAWDQHQKYQKEGEPIPQEPFTSQPEITRPITQAEARGNSRGVTYDEYQHLASEGRDIVNERQASSSPTIGLDKNWDAIKEQTWKNIQEPWGGISVDSHTGKPHTSKEEKYAIGAGHNTVSLPIVDGKLPTKEEFFAAMDRAKAQFAGDLQKKGYNLGVFHDQDAQRIDIDPSIIVNTEYEAEAVGAYTRQDGGAYNFATGNGHFVPHVPDHLMPSEARQFGAARDQFQPGEQVVSSAGTNGVIVSRETTAASRSYKGNFYKVKWDNGATTTINGEKLNGAQPKTTGPAEGTSEAGVSGETSVPSQISQPNEVGGQEPTGTNVNADITQAPNLVTGEEGIGGNAESGTVQPSNLGAGAIRPDAGDVARIAGATADAPVVRDANGRPIRDANGDIQTITPDFKAETYIAGNIQATERGTTASEQPSETGTARGSTSDNVSFPQTVAAIAPKFSLDLSDPTLPQISHGVRLLPEQHQENLAFINKPLTSKEPLNRPLLAIPDNPAFIPEVTGKPSQWKSLTLANKLVGLIREHANGDPTLESLPIQITDDASRVALTLKGWAQRFFYDNAKSFPNSIVFDKGQDKLVWSVAQAVFGDKMSVLMDARATISFHSMLKAGVFKNEATGVNFDHNIFQSSLDAGIVKNFSASGVSRDNLVRASLGLRPDTQKIGDFQGAMLGEARAPVDMWRARLAFGINNTPHTKLYDYEFGRNNFLSRLFPSTHVGPDGETQIPFMPYHQQSAEWFGYQQHVVESMVAIKKAALSTGDPALIKMANGLKANLISKDLAEVFRDRYGLTEGSKPPVLPFHELLAEPKVAETLMSISKELYTRRYLKGKVSPKNQDVLDIQERMSGNKRVADLLNVNAKIRTKLSSYYKKYFVDTPTVRGDSPLAAQQSLDRNVGPITLKIMEHAYAIEHPADFKKLGDEAGKLLGLVNNWTPSFKQQELDILHAGADYQKDLGESLAQPLAELSDKMGLPQGLATVNVMYGDGERNGIANVSPVEPSQVNINARYANYVDIVKRQLAPRLQRELTSVLFKGLKGHALEKVKSVILKYSDPGISALRSILAHELGHVVQNHVYGTDTINIRRGWPEEEMLPAAHALLDIMTPKYMIGLVREGLGNEIESLLNAHSSSINEYLGRVKGSEVQGEVMPLYEAINTILEHQADQWAMFHHEQDYSHATEESYRRSVYAPEIAEANARELGQIYQKALKVLDDPLAVTAEVQLSGRGPNPSIDSTVLQPEEVGAGPAARGKLDPAAVQSGTSRWVDAGTADQEVTKGFVVGEQVNNLKASIAATQTRMSSPDYKPQPGDKAVLAALHEQVGELNRQSLGPPPIRKFPVDPRFSSAGLADIQKATANAAAAITRKEGEGDSAFASRMIEATPYKNLEHTLAIANAARDGAVVPAKDAAGNPGFKIGQKFYQGSPNDHVQSWHPDFHKAIHTVLDNTKPLLNEPAVPPIGIIPAEQLKLAFADENRPPSGARVGATSITAKGPGVSPFEKTLPSMSANDFNVSSHAQKTPTSKLSSGSAGNKVKAPFESIQGTLDLAEGLLDKGPFDPEAAVETLERLEQADIENPQPLTPMTSGGDQVPPIGDGGQDPKGRTAEEKKADLQKQIAENSAVTLRGYLQALKDSLAIEDPTHQRIAAGINDLTAQMARTFGMDKWYKDSRLWVRDATGELHAYGKAYDKLAEDVRGYIGKLEADSPGANQRISEVMYARTPDARKALLENMAPGERELANHLHNYWKLTGDVLTRAGVIKSALENYLPLMIEPQSRTGTFTGVGKNYKGSTPHAVARQRIDAGPEKGQLKFESPEELQAYADDAELKHPNGEPWKVRTDIADIFSAHGKSVTQALTMKHAIDRLHYNSEVPVGKGRIGETARPILTNKEINDRSNPIVGENRHEYVSASTLIGPWRSALKYNRWTKGGDRVQEDYWIHKKVADAMEREASVKQMEGDNIATNVAKKINTVNTIWKQYQFLLTPMHAYSMLGNVSAHAGFNPLGTLDVFRNGDRIVNGPDNTEFLALTRAGGPDKSDLAAGGPAKLLEQIPVLGDVLKGYHETIWNKIMYQMTYGLASKMAKEHLSAMANKDPNHIFTEGDQTDAYSFGMERAKRALGSLSNMDMSKNWNLWGSVLFLANKWTTAQMRTLGEAFSIGPLKDMMSPLAKLGGALPLEGHTPEATAFMQARSIRMSQQLILGGLIRLAMLGTVASTGISSLLNNGVASNPYQNFQKDPAHTFDIYQGRDANGQDQWIKLPFYLFQREMLDWGMSAVKANQEGKPFLDVNQLGESVLTAPFMKFAGKLDPATKLSLELSTGQEMNAWMKGYSKYGIDDDPQITNINKSLQLMGIVDGGSLENRLLYAMRSLSPSLSFPTNMAKPANDFPAVLSALGLGVGPLAVGDPKNIALGAVGTSQMGGTKFMQGPDGQMEPSWKYYNDVNHKADLGQQILAIAQTLGTGTADQETNKMQQMETLRQQAGFTPAQLVQLLMYRAGSSSGLQSIITQGLPPTAPGTPKIGAPTKIGNVTLTPQQEVAYQSVTSQKEVLAMEQAMSDPNWKTLDYSQRQSELNDLKGFANKITNEQFAIALGTKKGPVLTTPQANAMLGEFGVVKRQTQDVLNNSSTYTQASPQDQSVMMADRLAASQNAVWEKYYGATTAMKGATDNTLAQYVVLQSGLRDEARQLVEDLPSYKQSFDPMAQQQQLTMSLNFADNLVNQYLQGKSPKAFGAPLTQIELTVAVKNGVVLQDAALNQLHQSYIYQEAPQNDQLALDAKYATLAHNVALEDTRLGKETSVGHTGSFNTILNTTLAADEGYQNLVEQFFGTGGRVVLAQKQAELADLKARFRQEYNIAPADLSKYDRMINLWYEQQNPDYKGFLYYRTQWEKYDPLGKAYRATVQSNYGFEQNNPLAIPTG